MGESEHGPPTSHSLIFVIWKVEGHTTIFELAQLIIVIDLIYVTRSRKRDHFADFFKLDFLLP